MLIHIGIAKFVPGPNYYVCYLADAYCNGDFDDNFFDVWFFLNKGGAGKTTITIDVKFNPSLEDLCGGVNYQI